MCNEIERRRVADHVVVGVEQCRVEGGGRGFIPDLVDPSRLALYGVPDWIKGFEVVTPKGETLFVPVGSKIKIAT